MAALLDPDKCPRCAWEVENTGVDEWTCENGGCPGFWASARGWEKECIARDVAGTRAKVSDKDWLEGKGGSSLRGDLNELAMLIRVLAFDEVRRAVAASIEGREDQLERDGGNRGSSFVRLTSEISVLGGMQTWVENQMRAITELAEDE